MNKLSTGHPNLVFYILFYSILHYKLISVYHLLYILECLISQMHSCTVKSLTLTFITCVLFNLCYKKCMRYLGRVSRMLQ